MFALSKPSIKFEVLEMVLILVLVSVKLKNFYFEEYCKCLHNWQDFMIIIHLET